MSISSLNENDPLTVLDSLTGTVTIARLTGTADGTGSSIVRLTYAFDNASETPFILDASTGAFDTDLDVSHLALGEHTLRVKATDAARNVSVETLHLGLPVLPQFNVTSFTPTAMSEDVGVTFRPQVYFSRPVDPASLNANNFYATDTTGAKVGATIVPASDGSFAWLFFTQPLPAPPRSRCTSTARRSAEQATGRCWMPMATERREGD